MNEPDALQVSCAYCTWTYERAESDSLMPETYCSKDCEIEDTYGP